ncbi:hypothetical protein FF2_037592 [Malus domestica]
MTQGEPFETNLNGPIWMIQTWLQWYFPKFRVANLEFPEGVAPTRILAEAASTDHTPPSPAFTSSKFVGLDQTWNGARQS